MRFAEGQAVDQPQRYPETLRNTRSQRREKSADSSWTHRGLSPRKRVFEDREKILTFAEGQAVDQPQRYPETMRDSQGPRGEKSADSSWTSSKTSLRRLRENYALCGRSGCGPRQPLAATNCQGSYQSQSGTLVRWSFLNYNSASQLRADLLAQLPGLGDRAFAKG